MRRKIMIIWFDQSDDRKRLRLFFAARRKTPAPRLAVAS